MLNLKHGGHILDDNAPGAEEITRKLDDAILVKNALRKGEPRPTETPFDYLFLKLKDDPQSHLPADDPAKVVADLKALGTAMIDDPPGTLEGNSIIPPVYTYWGQFIDHDLTANTDRDPKVLSDITKPDLEPIPPDEVTKNLKNLRRPAPDLDSVYGNGPAFIDPHSKDAGFYDGPRFRIGKNHEEGIPGDRIPPEGDLDRDLPRIGKLLDAGIITEDIFTDEQKADPNFRTRAFIGDARNDENLIIGQFHLAFLRFHNEVVERIKADPHRFGLWRRRPHDAVLFERARQLTRWHYQWLVVHDWLKTVTLSGIIDKILLGGPKHYTLRNHELFMPLEYSVAGFRFGHTMVRDAYDHNRNFGKKDGGRGVILPVASFDLLFLFTGNGFVRDRTDPTRSTPNPFGGQGPTLPFNWVIEWDRFTDKGSSDPTHFARKIDTRLVPSLRQMVNEGTNPEIQDDANPANKPIRELLRFLARRNLLRGYLLSLPTGQSVAQTMGVPPLTEAELRQNNSDALNAALEQGGFLQRTPLWYYVLKEAEVRANGNSLGELGSRLVCETIIGLLVNDRGSFLNQRGGWDPSEGVRLDNGDPIVTIRDFLKFARVALGA
jgi:heme peroxidase